MEKVLRIYFMGGVFLEVGNVTPLDEEKFIQDFIKTML
ncbi:hypothetical protein B4077_2650 [Bacillus cereus]|uniref:Uncharacterized protein n=1 Tax=Bacillus cereus TaxID=1396 RepID=A0A0G8F629_BACCE|nr:hypothetical protein B4077_2650 [Bacillus cereus]